MREAAKLQPHGRFMFKHEPSDFIRPCLAKVSRDNSPGGMCRMSDLTSDSAASALDPRERVERRGNHGAGASSSSAASAVRVSHGGRPG